MGAQSRPRLLRHSLAAATTAPTRRRARWRHPTEGVDSPGLAALLVEHWDLEVALDPLDATFLGDHRADTMLPPITRSEVAVLQARRRALVDQIVALDAGPLSARDQLTHAILVERLTAEADLDVCDHERWALSPRRSTIGQLDNIATFHPLLSSDDAASYRARIEAMPAAVDAYSPRATAARSRCAASTRRCSARARCRCRFLAERILGTQVRLRPEPASTK